RRAIDSTMPGSNVCHYGIFNIMTTGDAYPDMFNRSKSMEIELKKSAFGGDVAGKKLPPAHAVNIFIDMMDVIREHFCNGLVNDELSSVIDLPNKLPEQIGRASCRERV